MVRLELVLMRALCFVASVLPVASCLEGRVDGVEAAQSPGGTRYDDPHEMRRLRYRAWADLGQEMRPLQYTLLRA